MNPCRSASPLARSIALIALLLMVLSGCVKVPQFTDKPFTADRAEFFRTVKVIALAPMSLTNLKQADRIRASFEADLTEQLKGLGFTVLPSDKFGSLWDSLSKQEGGLYDPATGKRNDDKVKEIRKRVVTELAAQQQFDAVLRPSIFVSAARFSGCTARWNGVEQSIGSCSLSGRISVLSLLVRIENKEGNVLFRNAGGIQPNVRLKTGFFQSPQFEDLEEEFILYDPERNRVAVATALAPFVRKPGE
jgi:hypothetical protein